MPLALPATEPRVVPRRVLLGIPVALGGWALLFYRRERPLAEAAENGSGQPVEIAIFASDGRYEGLRRVGKLVRTEAEWRRELGAVEFAITREKGTELAYANRYWNNHAAGLYRCTCCGNAVFRSEDKFDSGTGWPSFWRPVAAQNIATAKDTRLAAEVRTEVVCAKCDAHMGHVFPDGPRPSGLRYCLNSAALRFLPYA